MLRHIKRERARRDIIESFTYICQDNPTAAERFLAAVESTFTELTEMPLRGAKRFPGSRRFKEIRACRVNGFPNWLIFYLVDDNRVDVLRVLHGARDLESLFTDEE